MFRSLRGFVLPAVGLLAPVLGATAPAVAAVPSDAASSDPSAYATPAGTDEAGADSPAPASPPYDGAAAPDTRGAEPADPTDPAGAPPAAEAATGTASEPAGDPAASSESAAAGADRAAAQPAGTWVRDAQGWRYLEADWQPVTNQVKEVNGVSYAFDATGHVARGWWREGASWYRFASSGALMSSTWVREGGSWFYLGAGGVMATGWLGISGRWNYFDAWDGFWVSDRDSFAADWQYARTLTSPTNYLLVVDTSAPRCMSFYWRVLACRRLAAPPRLALLRRRPVDADGARDLHHRLARNLRYRPVLFLLCCWFYGRRYGAVLRLRPHLSDDIYPAGFYAIEMESRKGTVFRGRIWMSTERVAWIRGNVAPGAYIVAH